MKRGPKPVPTTLKKLRGTMKTDDIQASLHEPKPRKGHVAPPEDVTMDKIAVREWNRVTDELDFMGLLYNVDRNQIAAYCMAYSLWSRATKELVSAKTLTQITKGKADGAIPRAYTHPMVQVIRANAEIMLRIAIEFGMTPSSRVRVSAGKGKPATEKVDKDEDFFA